MTHRLADFFGPDNLTVIDVTLLDTPSVIVPALTVYAIGDPALVGLDHYAINLLDGIYECVFTLSAGYSGTILYTSPDSTDARVVETVESSAGVLAQDVTSAYNVQQTLELLLSRAIGKVAGAGPGTTLRTIRNPADTATVITETVDDFGNRSTVSVTP